MSRSRTDQKSLTDRKRIGVERRLQAAEELARRPGSPGEQAAAQAAVRRLRARLEELGGPLPRPTLRNVVIHYRRTHVNREPALVDEPVGEPVDPSLGDRSGYW